jgi:hypothetical protein
LHFCCVNVLGLDSYFHCRQVTISSLNMMSHSRYFHITFYMWDDNNIWINIGMHNTSFFVGKSNIPMGSNIFFDIWTSSTYLASSTYNLVLQALSPLLCEAHAYCYLKHITIKTLKKSGSKLYDICNCNIQWYKKLIQMLPFSWRAKLNHTFVWHTKYSILLWFHWTK